MNQKQTILNIHNAIRNSQNKEAIDLLSANPLVLKMWTPYGSWLQDASRQNNLELAKWLIDRGLDIDAYNDSNEWPPLAIACAKGHFEMVHLLLNAGASIDTATSLVNPLFSAIVGGDSPSHRKIAELLIARGINILIRYANLDNMDALDLAIEYGRREIATVLEKQR
jgi:ankyrin repeat protein